MKSGSMSRIGNKPITIPSDVKVNITGNIIEVTGKLGTLKQDFPSTIEVEMKDNELVFKRSSDIRTTKMIHGTIRSLVNNMVIGVTEGYTRELELMGVGYRVALEGKALSLAIGFKHQVKFEIPDYLKVEVPSQTEVRIFGIDKQKVGLYAATLRGLKPPEPYKGKGIRYKGEVVRKKEVKTAVS